MPEKSYDPKTLAAICWAFAPITSLLWKDHRQNLVRQHARQSLYLGVFNAVTVVLAIFLQLCTLITLGLFFEPLSLLISCMWGIVWLIIWLSILLPRFIGIVKALQGEQWEVPYIGEFMQKFINL